MRHRRLYLLFLGLVFCAAGSRSMGEESPRDGSAEHTWKPMIGWYPDLYVSKLPPQSIEHSEVRFQMGDDARWAAPGWDDRGWKVIDRSQIPADKGVFWLRIRVRSRRDTERIPSSIVVGGFSTREVYWDGAWMGAAGTPGNDPKEQVQGPTHLRFELPWEMTAPGEHVVALRMSTYGAGEMHGNFVPFHLWVLPPHAYRGVAGKHLLPAMAVGAMLTVGIAVLVMWLVADRRLILGLFCALCLSAALLVAAAAAPLFWMFARSLVQALVVARMVLVVVVASLLPAIAMVHLFPAWPRRWLAAPLLLEGTLACYCYYLPMRFEPLVVVLWRVAFTAVLMVGAWAAWRRREGAWLILTGMAMTFWLFESDKKHFEHIRFPIAFLPILVGLIAAIALQLRRERLEARDTKLTAARLEIELLKKSLQPHFLMNTLTALSQVIEEKPAAAVRLIDDLALELRSLTRFSGERQVSLGEELALCRAHLGVMSARTDRTWKLDTEGVDATASVPPAVFLTLIENGFSHQHPCKDATTFTLRCERTNDGMRYTFRSPGIVTPDTNRATGGTGLRYICARLEESFHDAWKLTQGAVSGGWETIIELRDSARSGRSV